MIAVMNRFVLNLDVKRTFLPSFIRKMISKKNMHVANFDHRFFSNYYRDLLHLDNYDKCLRHYLKHGIYEGRIINGEEMIAALVCEHGPLPDDFSPMEYRVVNPDLNNITDRYLLEEHYILFGRSEKRNYNVDISKYEEEYSRNIRNITDDESCETFRQFLKYHGITSSLWLFKFNLGQFYLLNDDWISARPRTRIEGIYLFVRNGIERLAPIAADCRFDPAFYKESECAPIGAEDAELYRHWLSVGLARAFSV